MKYDPDDMLVPTSVIKEPDATITLIDMFHGITIDERVELHHCGKGNNGTYRVISICNNELGLERIRETLWERIWRWLRPLRRLFRW